MWVNENDQNVGFIFQYNYSQIKKFPAWMNATSSSSLNFGLAIGESIFWDPWEKYLNGNAKDVEVIAEFSERFQKLLNLWSDF